MHRDKYVYEFIVIMSSLIPGTEGEGHRGRRDWPCWTTHRVARGRVAGSTGVAVEVGLFYWEFWRVVARICESRLFDSFQR